MRVSSLLVLLAPLLLSAPAVAQTPSTRAPTPATERVTEIDFREGDDVLGARDRPAGELTVGEGRARRPSLIVVRGDFRAALLGSADAL